MRYFAVAFDGDGRILEVHGFQSFADAEADVYDRQIACVAEVSESGLDGIGWVGDAGKPYNADDYFMAVERWLIEDGVL